MACTFEVVGTFPLSGRGLVVYGNIISGIVRKGDLLLIPLNNSLSISAEITSVEFVDAPAGSYVGLLLGSGDELESHLLEGFNIAGEILEIRAPVDSSTTQRQSFEEAKARLLDLLANIPWPMNLTWVPEDHVIRFPQKILIFRPQSGIESERAARRDFESFASTAVAVRIGAVGHVRDMTFVAVWPIRELAQGEEMFIQDGVKVDALTDILRISIVKSPLRWLLARRLYEEWIRKRDAILARSR